jgi:CubicO group peptidase (beta-lactamase class C family)
MKGLAPAQHFRGTVVAERNGHVLVEKSYGLAVEQWKVPNSRDTKFELASVTKQFTAAAILQLVDSGPSASITRRRRRAGKASPSTNS